MGGSAIAARVCQASGVGDESDRARYFVCADALGRTLGKPRRSQCVDPSGLLSRLKTARIEGVCGAGGADRFKSRGSKK